MGLELAYSRATKTAEQLGTLAADRHRFLGKKILLTGEREILWLENGRQCLLSSIRLALRICQNVAIHLPEGCDCLRREAARTAEQIAFGQNVEFPRKLESYNRFDAILSVGARAHPELPWTTINSNGFVARATSGPADIPAQCDLGNPIGALAASCLGVGEIFKRLIGLKSERGALLNGFSFSLRNYSSSAPDYGPQIPRTLPDDLLVVGAGAIGNGIVHLISCLPFSGKIHLVDREEFGPENLGTCILVSPRDLGTPKGHALAAMLRKAGIRAEGFYCTLAQYAAGLTEYPSAVACGLDNIDVRHEVQRELWPDIAVDGAIGDFTCQVSRHPWSEDVACLICMFQKPVGQPAEEVQSEATGISRDRLRNPDSLVTEVDVCAAPVIKQHSLKSMLGQPICAVVQHAMAKMFSSEEQQEGFEPSVPFVACFSSCMVMAEALAHLCKWKSILEPRFQFDFLHGPAFGLELPQTRRQGCICNRRKNIDKLRNLRRMLHLVPTGERVCGAAGGTVFP